MSKDHEYIKELFDSDGVTAPESLSEENMLAMLNAAEEKPAGDQAEMKEDRRFEPGRTKAHPSLKRWMAVAAVAVIAIFGISGLRDILSSPPDTSLVGDELYTFKNESEIERLLKSMDNSPGYERFRLGGGQPTGILLKMKKLFLRIPLLVIPLPIQELPEAQQLQSHRGPAGIQKPICR